MRRIKFSKGSLYMLYASVLFAGMNAVVKQVDHIPAEEIVFFRSLFSIVACWISLKAQKISLWGNNHKLLIMRGIFGTIALILYFNTLQNMPLATASVIYQLAPLFTAVIAAVFLKEKLGTYQLVILMVCFSGVVLIKNFDGRISWLWILTSVSAAFFGACAYNCIRALKLTEHPLVIVFYFPLLAIPVTGVFLFNKGVMPHSYDWWYLLLIGILTQAAQVLMTKAYQIEKAAQVATVSYTSVIYSFLLGWLFWGELFNLGAYIGMAIIIVAILGNLWLQHKEKIT